MSRIISTKRKIESEAAYDLMRDCIVVRLRIISEDEEGNHTVHGVIVELPENAMYRVSPGAEYTVHKITRWDSFTEEIE